MRFFPSRGSTTARRNFARDGSRFTSGDCPADPFTGAADLEPPGALQCNLDALDMGPGLVEAAALVLKGLEDAHEVGVAGARCK